MNWPLDLFLFTVVAMFLWGLILQKVSSSRVAKVIVLGNVAVYIFYTLCFFKPIFDIEAGRGGGAFAAGMYIYILTPLHLLAVYFAILIFNNFREISWLKQLLTFVVLPVMAIAFGYNFAVKQQETVDKKQRQYFTALEKRLEQKEVNNSRSEADFESFILHFVSDSAFQLEHIRLPLPEFYLTSELETDTVNHYYEHTVPYLLKGRGTGFFVYNDWENEEIASSKRTLVVNENDWRAHYHFRYDGKWVLVEIQKYKPHQPLPSRNKSLPK
ncbi:hypothetical protein [Pontibacter chinhatensis]|uniref:Uncharacterized protein n=1 Tax=Pontibacter chinhatensis TaxID=1436961 RepID=A0A1I2VRB5_9BACT|nr:hypothetical protein [Pontibacter chinhatensis]SFG90857.1 hypothetical protein SAMN05421739_104276 [Pontibacter chinhatensis]